MAMIERRYIKGNIIFGICVYFRGGKSLNQSEDLQNGLFSFNLNPTECDHRHEIAALAQRTAFVAMAAWHATAPWHEHRHDLALLSSKKSG